MAEPREALRATEQKILEEEKKIEAELGKEEAELKRLNRRVLYLALALVIVLGGGIAGFAYWKVASGQVYIEKSSIEAPQIDLAPENPGVLENVFVREGDIVSPDTAVARVGDELVKSKIAGVIIHAQNSIGALVNRGEAVVSMIDPDELRVVGQVEEDKGLADIRVGAPAIFTVDAFGGKEYSGTVDEVAPTSRASDVVFSISDKREEKEFDVKVRFDIAAHPELKNGMSAKLWVFKQ